MAIKTTLEERVAIYNDKVTAEELAKEEATVAKAAAGILAKFLASLGR